MHGFVRDARYAIRILAAAPGFTLTAILTLALAIGANVAVFSAVYGVLLREFPYREADRLVLVRAEVDYAGTGRPVPVSVPLAELEEWQRPLDSIATIAFYTPDDVVALTGDDGSEVLQSAVVSGGFFAMMAGPFAAGRPLQPADDQLPATVISERLARRLFSAPERAIGGQLPLTRGTFTVIGVAGRAFQFPKPDVDVWMPVGFVRPTNQGFSFRVIARLEADRGIERVRGAVQPMFERSAVRQRLVSEGMRTTITRLPDDIVSAVRPALLVLFASVLMVLLIASGNLLNLLLARSAAREHEFAIRRALGASTGRLMRQLLAESAILGGAGAACGVLLARLSLTALSRFASNAVPRVEAIDIDLPVLLFAACLAILTTILAGIAPLSRALDGSAVPSRSAAGTTTPWRAKYLQRGLCVVQVALAATLLIGATLMGRSLVRLLNIDLGVTTDHVLTASVNLAFSGRPPDAQTIARIDRVIEHIRELPGVRAVGAGTGLPPSFNRVMITLRRTGEVADYRAAAVPATPGYFPALRMRLLKGRFFTEADDDRHPPVIIISEDTARRFFGTDEPIGRTMSMPVLRDGKSSNADMTVVGVTANVKYAGLTAPPDDVVYRPFAQQPWVAPYLIVRTSGDPADFALTLRRGIATVDKGIVVSSVTPLHQLVMDATAQPQFRTVVSASLATLALGIAVIGLYGVVSYAVSRRTKEIGIRVALGANPRNVLTMVLRDGLIVAVAGIVLGTASTLVLTKALAGLLYEITPTDPTSFMLVSFGLLGLTGVASYIPARRAARMEALRALRTE